VHVPLDLLLLPHGRRELLLLLVLTLSSLLNTPLRNSLWSNKQRPHAGLPSSLRSGCHGPWQDPFLRLPGC
jgi:hypothetical protein